MASTFRMVFINYCSVFVIHDYLNMTLIVPLCLPVRFFVYAVLGLLMFGSLNGIYIVLAGLFEVSLGFLGMYLGVEASDKPF